MYQEYKDDGLMVMMVFEGTSHETAADFAVEYDLSFPVLTDVNQEVFPRFDPTRETPISVMFQEGAVVYSIGVAWYPAWIEEVLGI